MKRKTRTEIQTFFNSDRAILMFCIGIALVFWLVVKLSKSYKTTKDYEISYTLPEGKTFVEPPLRTVRAAIEGEGWELISNHFRNRNSIINFELTDLPSQAINSTAIIDKIQGIISDNIDVLNVNIDFNSIKIEKQGEKMVPIVLHTDLEFAPRFHMIDSIQLSNDSIKVLGPSSLIEQLQEWQSELLVLKNIQKTTVLNVPLALPKNSQIILENSEVEVTIPVEEFTEKDVFVPILIRNAPDSLKVFPENIKMSFTVGLNNYNEINSSDFVVEVDLKDIPLNTENNTIPVLVTRQPNEIKGLNYNPKSVEFFFVETVEVDSLSN